MKYITFQNGKGETLIHRCSKKRASLFEVVVGSLGFFLLVGIAWAMLCAVA